MKRLNFNFKLILIIFLTSVLFGCSNKIAKNTSDPFTEIKPKNDEIATQTSNAVIPTTKIDKIDKYNENLCTDNEKVLFSFKTGKGAKTLSICVSKKQPDYIVYRFGTKENIELEYPPNKTDSWNKFAYSYYLRGGGKENAGLDLNYLSFSKDGYEYQVYQEYSAENECMNVGIRINEKATNRKVEVKGLSNSIIGSLVNLRDNKKIKIVQNSGDDNL